MSVPLRRTELVRLTLDTPKGRGIFANSRLAAGTVIDTAPVILLEDADFSQRIQHTQLIHYSYNWPRKCVSTGKTVMGQAIVLGLGSMFNHSVLRQNVGWRRDLDGQVVVYTALRDIDEGEELLISYGNHLTFRDTEAEELARARAEEEEDPLRALDVDL